VKKPTTPRGKPVPPLALLLLASFVALPFVLYFVPARWWHAEFGPPPRLVTDLIRPAPRPDARPDAPPTVGMTVEPSGYGTVSTAPFVLAEAGPAGRVAGHLPPEPIATDVGRYVRGIPQERWENRDADAMTICTLEGPPVYSGRIVLVDGCLRFQDEGSDKPGPLVLGIQSVHRDAEGYLAVGLRDAVPEFEIRVGEPQGQFVGVGCSMDRPVPAPPRIARACGVTEMRRLATIKRKRLCSAEERARIERYRRESRLTARQSEAASRACRDLGTPDRQCPPPIPESPPMPPPPNLFDCRLEPPQSSQGSSTQP
jgi:hypothetical protein